MNARKLMTDLQSRRVDFMRAKSFEALVLISKLNDHSGLPLFIVSRSALTSKPLDYFSGLVHRRFLQHLRRWMRSNMFTETGILEHGRNVTIIERGDAIQTRAWPMPLGRSEMETIERVVEEKYVYIRVSDPAHSDLLTYLYESLFEPYTNQSCDVDRTKAGKILDELVLRLDKALELVDTNLRFIDVLRRVMNRNKKHERRCERHAAEQGITTTCSEFLNDFEVYTLALRDLVRFSNACFNNVHSSTDKRRAITCVARKYANAQKYWDAYNAILNHRVIAFFQKWALETHTRHKSKLFGLIKPNDGYQKRINDMFARNLQHVAQLKTVLDRFAHEYIEHGCGRYVGALGDSISGIDTEIRGGSRAGGG